MTTVSVFIFLRLSSFSELESNKIFRFYFFYHLFYIILFFFYCTSFMATELSLANKNDIPSMFILFMFLPLGLVWAVKTFSHLNFYFAIKKLSN